MSNFKLKVKELKKKYMLIGTFIYLWSSKISIVAATAADKKEDTANAIRELKVVTGTQKLIGDATTVAVIIAPLLGVVLGVYFHIRKSAADEQDQKIWDKRIKADIYSVIGAIVFSSVLKAVLAYY